MRKKRLLGFATGAVLLSVCSGPTMALTATPRPTRTPANTSTPGPTNTPTFPVIKVTPQPRQGARALNMQAVSTDMKFKNTGGNCILVVKNASGDPTTVTVEAVPDPYTGDATNLVKAVAAGSTDVFGPFRPGNFNNRTDDKGWVQVNFSATTSVTADMICFLQ